MAYRNHRFTYGHAARSAGLANVVLFDTSDVDQSENLTRLLDDQMERLYTLPGIVSYRIVIDRMNDADRPVLTRCIIPAGHGFADDGVWVKPQDASSVSAWTDLAGDDHEGIFHYADDGGLIDILLSPGTDRRYAALLVGPAQTTATTLGEVVFSDVWQPTTGVVSDWQHPPPTGNDETIVMRSGRSYTVVSGEPVRTFRVEHKGVSAADLRGYDALFAAVGTRRPFWYEHSDSADYRELQHDFASTAGLTAGGCTLALGTGSDGTASEAVAITPTTGTVTVDGSFSAPVDLRGKRLSLDLRITDTDLASDVSAEIALVNSGAGRIQYTRIGRPGKLTAGANWCRYYIDAESLDTVSGDEAIDLSAVDGWRVRFAKPPVAEIRMDKLYTYDTEKQPRLCRFTSTPRREQDNPVPKSSLGPTYTIVLEMEEVLG